MPIPELRAAAADFVLGQFAFDELPAIVDQLVNYEFITPTVADLYLTKRPTRHEHGDKFIRMLRELYVPLPSNEEAVWMSLHWTVRSMIEGAIEPSSGLAQLVAMERNSKNSLDLQDFENCYYRYDWWPEPGDPADARIELDREAVELARAWEQRHGPRVRQEMLDAHGGNVRKLAEAIQTELAFDRLPILADALEEAGCSDTDILEHCRFPGRHRGVCWVIDLLLGGKALAP
jgi:hypothetical protein